MFSISLMTYPIISRSFDVYQADVSFVLAYTIFLSAMVVITFGLRPIASIIVFDLQDAKIWCGLISPLFNCQISFLELNYSFLTYTRQ